MAREIHPKDLKLGSFQSVKKSKIRAVGGDTYNSFFGSPPPARTRAGGYFVSTPFFFIPLDMEGKWEYTLYVRMQRRLSYENIILRPYAKALSRRSDAQKDAAGGYTC